MKLLKNKKLFFSLIALTTITATATLAVACSNAEVKKTTLEETKIKKIDWAKVTTQSIYDAVVVSWADGDTVKVKITDAVSKSTGLSVGVEYSIRLNNIDTPEVNVNGSPAGPNELKYANAASAFGKKVMPKDTKVRITTTHQRSYERVVGGLFYNEAGASDYQTNYENELVKQGLTLPLAGSTLTSYDFEENNVNGYILKAIGNSLYYAWENRLGLFDTGKSNSTDEEAMTFAKDVYKKRGAPDPGYFLKTNSPNVFDDWSTKS
ncbi:thermonuclease family protein [Mycoplasmopsis agassizii]|uniref:thermonuclease family protein n=1 Tax=Mycoplasmopsis agassizii TaxID=33922 RepID=UPI003529AA3A